MSARLYLVAYDISCPKRWRRVYKAVRRLCQRSQLSVFVCRGTPARMARLEKDLRRLVHETEDKLMVLDLGPAHSAAAQLKAQNAQGTLSEIAQLNGVVL
jgi:CRISPR-associated protein Cas2